MVIGATCEHDVPSACRIGMEWIQFAYGMIMWRCRAAGREYIGQSVAAGILGRTKATVSGDLGKEVTVKD